MENKDSQNSALSFEQFSVYDDEKIGLSGAKLAQEIYQALMSEKGLLDFGDEGIELRDHMLQDEYFCQLL